MEIEFINSDLSESFLDIHTQIIQVIWTFFNKKNKYRGKYRH
ncbi:hypothetical protein M23134_07369 [Microscilla marina ATCC 23134]|uniref:Uncharacterized protein n=1 Tax=Microscilla marina ATCC 23134 TaxID=313606 RepID=A1ZEL1_MICM2|nr:hypothetical protein M23134_07369 [Microscilla marina ATCC 23134]